MESINNLLEEFIINHLVQQDFSFLQPEGFSYTGNFSTLVAKLIKHENIKVQTVIDDDVFLSKIRESEVLKYHQVMNIGKVINYMMSLTEKSIITFKILTVKPEILVMFKNDIKEELKRVLKLTTETFAIDPSQKTHYSDAIDGDLGIIISKALTLPGISQDKVRSIVNRLILFKIYISDAAILRSPCNTKVCLRVVYRNNMMALAWMRAFCRP